MKLCKVLDLREGDILAKDVMTDDYRVLYGEGTVLNSESISRLINYNIGEVSIKQEVNVEEVAILKEEVQEEFHKKLQSILEKHTYSNSAELSQLAQTADNIIGNILQEEEVAEKIYDIRERSADVYEHSISVCSIATIIALKMNIHEKAVHDIGVACLLHELGLRYLTIDYENVDLSEMSEIDLAEYHKHPVYGYSALQNESWLSEEAKQIILYHHEKLDGSGYPLKATDIPMYCKIVQVCDAFDEMICGIGCKRTKVYEALEYLKICKGTQFDEEVVKCFMELIAVYPVGSYIKTNEGETAVVLRQNREFPDRPVIRIIKDKAGNPVKTIIIKDLVKITTLFIENVE